MEGLCYWWMSSVSLYTSQDGREIEVEKLDGVTFALQQNVFTQTV